MPRWVWFTPIGILVVFVGIWGFRLGWIAATISETDVIQIWTAHYIATQGSDAYATDCAGQPGAYKPIWILVSCVNTAGERVDYPVDRLGRLLSITPSQRQLNLPQT